MTKLDKIMNFVREHGFACRVVNGRVEIAIPYVNVDTNAKGIDLVYVTDWRGTMTELGY